MTPLEIRQLEGVDEKPQPNTDPILIPLTLPLDARQRRTLEPLENKK